MAADFSKQKQDGVSQLKNNVSQMLVLVAATKQLKQELIDAGFGPGGANQVVDADLTTAFPSLVATDIATAFMWIDNLDLVLGATSITTTSTGRTGYKALVRIKEA